MTSQFSVLLRQFRLQKGLTQQELGTSSGVSARTIRRFENGESANPQIETVRLLADALELGSDERAQMLAAVGGQDLPEAPPGNGNRVESASERRLAEAAGELALVVEGRLKREEELRGIQDPFPLPVRWELAPSTVMDHWENICRVLPGERAKPLDLAGRLHDIATVYRRIPSGRLVVLGRAGSGKSVLAARFALELLRIRDRSDPVPVIVNPGSWDPTTTAFRDWLADRLTRDFPSLATTGHDGPDLATVLVDAGRILPVLDGFDELAAGLHRDALRKLNATTLPLLVTSRPGEFLTAARSAALTAAAAVRLTDLTVTDLFDYLPRTTRKDAGATLWDPVLTELKEHPERPECVNLRAVLTTPLMVGLARAIYSDADGPDPAVLLDTARFGSQYELEDHLLGSFIPTVYQHQDARWDTERARGWLGYLARHLEQIGSADLAWWQLGTAMRRGARALVVGLVGGLAVGLLTGLLIWLAGPPVPTEANAFVIAVENVLGFGLAFGVGHAVVIARAGGALEPARVRLRARGGSRQLRSRLGPRFLIGVAGGICVGLILGLGNAAGHNPMGLVGFGFLGGLVTGAVMGTLTGLWWGLMAGFEAPVDIRSVVGPSGLLRTNRAIVVVEFLGLGLVLGLAHLVMSAVALGHLDPAAIPRDLAIGAVVGLAIGTCLSAWGQWLVFARVWLPLTGRLPWSVAAFLDDACRRGVLRQVGAVYQFRHARLQAHLIDAA
ncbi:helix-turn-helix transcriptional regulator [Labedaea rhizosphaerae]|uniref:NACHT domain-containing protein n=1 Tax=Labedaea rhizosphaerae TaxID=598644 RepID=A0A4R6S6G1_LABRH|nr:helix-turn-helix domain-containing protein [Labedaea rhizosphaerae]TDP94777.1 NACHT domain-containing protein [Labedaea rhizosphaerae]